MILRRLATLRDDLRSDTGRSAGWGLASEVGQLAVSLGMFAGLALVLDQAEFGRYSAIAAMAIIMANLAHAGSHVVMVRSVSRGARLEPEWQVTITTVTIGMGIGTLALLGLRSVFVPDVSPVTFTLIAVSQSLMLWIVEVSTQATQAVRRLSVGAGCKLSAAGARLASLIGFAVVGPRTLEAWAYWSIAGATVGALLALGIVERALEVRTRLRPFAPARLREGFPFVLSATSEGVLDSIDRPLLTANGYDADAGSYAIGYRIVSITLLPILAMARATDASFFERGAHSPDEVFHLARRLTIRAALYGLAVGALLALSAPLLPLVFGDKFDTAADVIRIVSVLPLLRALQMFPSNALTGANRHTTRLVLMVASMLVNLGLNLVLIPRHSWYGAAGTTLFAEALFALTLWIAATRTLRGTTEPTPTPHPERVS